MDDKDRFYPIILEDDNSLKQFFDRFYVIPKDYSFITAEDKKILDKYNTKLYSENVAAGKNGYIVFRGKKPKKLTDLDIQRIKNDTVSSQRALAFKYNVGVATINKIKNNKY